MVVHHLAVSYLIGATLPAPGRLLKGKADSGGGRRWAALPDGDPGGARLPFSVAGLYLGVIAVVMSSLRWVHGSQCPGSCEDETGLCPLRSAQPHRLAHDEPRHMTVFVQMPCAGEGWDQCDGPAPHLPAGLGKVLGCLMPQFSHL